MSATTNLCLVCNASCSLLRNSIPIFTDTPGGELNLPVVLQQLLNKEIIPTAIHSEVLCRKCYKLIDEFDELQYRVGEIKNEISRNYQNTLKSKEGVEKALTETKEDVMETQEKLLSRKGRHELPKKILDIPSSDEDDTQPVEEKQLESLTDIEMGLVKEDTNTSIDAETHTIHTFSNSDIEELAAQASGTILTHSEESVSFPELKSLVIKKEPILMESNKPNILKKRHQSGVIYSQNEIIQETGEIVKKITDNGITSLVSKAEDLDLYTCLVCVEPQRVAGDAKAIVNHFKDVHQEKLYICDICGLDFRRRNLLTAHVNEHIASEEGDFQCEVCNRIFNNLRLFRIHRRIHLPQAKAWQCNNCNKRYSSKNLLEEHMNTHLGVRPYVCNTCGKDFANKYSFRAHEKTHSSRPRPFECDKCGKSFLTQQNLAQHDKTHLSTKEYVCPTCNKRFGSAHNLDIHSIVHTGFKPFVCGLCGKCFARKAEIRDHERTHTGERPFQCEFCGATFSQRSNLQSHKRATHYDDKRYKCEDCDKCFKRRRLLDYHMKAAHTGERPYECETCKATFIYPEHFKKHRRIHTGEKPFVCEVCGKAFNSRDNRNAHRFVHSDKKPYECLVCGTGFMRKPHLYTHMQVENHLNDTIVVNQPRLIVDDKVGIGADSHLVTIEELTEESESKIFIKGEDNEDGIILNTAKLAFGDSSENEEEIIDEIEQVISTEDGEYEEILSTEAISASDTQIIDTPDGPIQLVKVKINEDGEEKEAWIKIVPE